LSELEGLCAQVIRSRDLDILSVNETELNHFASVVSEQGKGDLLSKAIGFKRHISARLDLHCSQFAASIESGSPTLVPAFEVIPCRTTGAGDSWNAANVFGQLLAWPAQERLLIANAAAAYYISDESGCQPTLEELADFIAATPLRGDGLQRMAG
jgi:ribokinase